MIFSGYTENPKELLHPQERRSFISTQPPLHHTFPPGFDRLLYVPLSSKENISLLPLLAPSILGMVGGFRAAASESVSFRFLSRHFQHGATTRGESRVSGPRSALFRLGFAVDGGRELGFG